MTIKVAAACKSGRLHAITQALMNSASSPDVYALSDVNNPRVAPQGHLFVGKTDDPEFVRDCIRKIKPDLFVIGPEEPLAAGVADMLAAEGVPCVGPTKRLAKIESSKGYTRRLMKKHGVEGCPAHEIFDSLDGIEDYLRAQTGFVIKPDGLTGGKGVRVSGEHIHSIKEALQYCSQLFAVGQPAIVIEEKLDGEEFSFQSFFDGKHIAHMIPVQDHKRAREGDEGPNTGGMGSYTCADHLLPFLAASDLHAAAEINRKVAEALVREEGGELYRGILYGGFILTKDGIKVIEYNARFGDPEIMNVLPLLENDFLDVCQAIVSGSLHRIDLRFKRRATVCKYIVPNEYPAMTAGRPVIDVSELDRVAASDPNLRVYYGAVEGDAPALQLTGSRAIGVVGIGASLTEAERIAERAANLVKGPVRHRTDIGTAPLIEKRRSHMRSLREESSSTFRTKLAS
jgi:phosphoribosylamine---glycine ligase